jgi:hypothetical protein
VVKLDDVKKLKCPTCGGTDFRNDGKVIICVPPGKGCVSASADVLIPEAARVPN